MTRTHPFSWERIGNKVSAGRRLLFLVVLTRSTSMRCPLRAAAVFHKTLYRITENKLSVLGTAFERARFEQLFYLAA